MYIVILVVSITGKGGRPTNVFDLTSIFFWAIFERELLGGPLKCSNSVSTGAGFPPTTVVVKLVT